MFHHLQKGNLRGAARLLESARRRLEAPGADGLGVSFASALEVASRSLKHERIIETPRMKWSAADSES